MSRYMHAKLPRIRSVEIAGPMALGVTWDDHPAEVVDLSGWIGGSAVIAALRRSDVFTTARVSEYRDAVEWGDAEGDLAIDAYHLRQIAEGQRRSKVSHTGKPRKVERA